MKILRKSITIFIVLILTFSSINNIQINTFAKLRNVTKIGVLFHDMNNKYTRFTKQRLEEIEKDNENIVKFTFFDAENNISIQSAMLNNIQNENFDLLVLDVFNVSESELDNTIFKIKQKGTPVIFLSVDQMQAEKFYDFYNKAIFLSADYGRFGIEQGEIISDLWNNSRNSIDKNEDNILNYIILKGKKYSPIATDITDAFVSTIKDSGIEAKQLEFIIGAWDREYAKNAIAALFPKYTGSIEAIIANNDDMAIGAIEALQGYGYNKGDKSNNIIIIGNDGLQEAKDLIDKGFMTATIVHNQNSVADAIYNVGMNLVNNIDPLENTNYKFENGQIIVPIPYSIYMNKPNI